eukprot:scaffold57442_cov70-Phaeocystis_antarctica.AAC.5
MRDGRHDLGTTPTVAPFEACLWHRLTPGMPYVILRFCNGTRTVAQGRVGKIRWCQAGWPNLRNG